MAKWYEEWFDKAEYELVYRHRDDNDASELLDTIERIVNPSPGAAILDLGCGRGRHSIALARRGYKMTGIDLSKQSIDDAHRRALEENVDVDFAVMDMRETFCNGCFDGVVNLFTAFGYFDERVEHLKVISSIATALRPGGWLVQDFLNAPFVRAHLVPETIDKRDDLTVEQHRWIEDGRINKKIILRSDEQSPSDSQTFSESVALLELSDFKGLYDDAGLELISTLGSYSGEPYSKTSTRLILVARKPSEVTS